MRSIFLAILVAPAALAHQASVSFSELDVHGREVDGLLRFALSDLRTQMLIDPANLPVPAMQRLLLDSFVIKTAGAACALQPGVTAAMEDNDGVAMRARWLCPSAVETLAARV